MSVIRVRDEHLSIVALFGLELSKGYAFGCWNLLAQLSQIEENDKNFTSKDH